MNDLPTPELKFFADLSVEVDKPQEVGQTHHGVRRLIPILGGQVQGLPHESLSEQEYRVLLLLAAGQRVADIATAMHLSPKTVSTYRTRVMEKMKLESNSDLTYYALKSGLIQ